MPLSSASQEALVLTVFFAPILAYLFIKRSASKFNRRLPSPTEITNILIHPIKSCHGLNVKLARLLPTGFDLGMNGSDMTILLSCRMLV